VGALKIGHNTAEAFIGRGSQESIDAGIRFKGNRLRDEMTRYLIALICISVATLNAQTTSSLTGRVADPSGAIIAGATVSLKTGQGRVYRETTTDRAGDFTFSQVAPATYSIEVRSQGFKTYVAEDVVLLVNTPITINVSLVLGPATESIEVKDAATQISTTDASIGNPIGEKAILELPLEARNVVGLLSLQPGVSYLGDPSERDDYRSGAVNGGKSDQSNVLLDGIDVNDQQTRVAFTSVLRTTLDSVVEFRTTTANGGADAGRTSGAQVSLVTKSGTNSLHGALYEFNRNTATTANSPLNIEAGLPRPALIRNVFGASVGGPLIKNKLFIFANYEGRRDRSQASVVRTVPTNLFRQGTFTYPTISGPLATVTPAEIASNIDPLHVGPAPDVLSLFQQYPQPNDSTVGDGINTAGYRFNAATPLRYDTYISRIDYNIDSGGKHTLFWRGQLQNDHVVPAIGVPQFPGQPDNQSQPLNAKGIAVGYTWVQSSRLVSSFSYGLTRQAYDNTGVQTAPYVTMLGVDPIQGTTTAEHVKIPVNQLSNNTSFSIGSHQLSFGGVARWIRVNQSNAHNSFSGALSDASELLPDNGASFFNALPNASPAAQLSIESDMTDLLGLITFGTGAFNYTIDGNLQPQGALVSRKYVDNEYELFIQDSWKATRSLTVTYGLRASLFPAISEANGYQVTTNVPASQWLGIRASLAAAGEPQSMAPPLSYNLSNAPGGRPLYPFQRHFAPRVAIAYSPQASDGLAKTLFGGPGKTVFRVGAGLFYDLFGQGLIQQENSGGLGFSSSIFVTPQYTASTAPRFTGLTQIPNNFLPQAPAFGFPQVGPNDFGVSLFVDNKLKSPYSINANVSVARELNHGFFFETAYVGRFSRHSLDPINVAAGTDLKDTTSGQDYFSAAAAMQGYLRSNAAVTSVGPVPFFENVYPGYAGGGFTATQNLYQYYWSGNIGNDTLPLLLIDLPGVCSPCSKFGPAAMFNDQYAGLQVLSSIGGGSYNALQVMLRKHFDAGLLFDINYTRSKCIDIGSTRESDGALDAYLVVNSFNIGQMRGLCDYDQSNNLSADFVAEVPIGRGHKFLSGINRWADAAIGGWQVSGIWRQSSGLPQGIVNGFLWATNWQQQGFADQALRPQITNRGGNVFADPSAAYGDYVPNFPGESGWRNVIRGQGYFSLDLGIGKRFVMPFSEKQSLQFRAEAFNVTNSSRFDIASANLNIGTPPPQFGTYSALLNSPRVMQFGLRYEF
jgi:hypothetical protein